MHCMVNCNIRNVHRVSTESSARASRMNAKGAHSATHTQNVANQARTQIVYCIVNEGKTVIVWRRFHGKRS